MIEWWARFQRLSLTPRASVVTLALSGAYLADTAIWSIGCWPLAA